MQRHHAHILRKQRHEQTTPTLNRARTLHARQVVNAALGTSGQPLDAQTRGFFETRFSHNFSNVRVHADAGAGRSADALNARAYTVGTDIVFGQGEYAPGTVDGRSLLAHELAHVVQEPHTRTPPHTKLDIGSPSDRAEREADAVAHAALTTTREPRESGALLAASQRSAPAVQNPVLRRTPKPAKTWAGQFIVDEYEIEQGMDNANVNGAEIKLRFQPNDFVDAEKIAFVQTAQSLSDGKPVNRFTKKKDQEVAAGRMIPESKPGKGTHVDQMPDSRTPLYAMESTGKELSAAKPEEFHPPEPKFNVDPGWRYTDSRGKLTKQDATMHDDPNLVQPEDKHVQQQQLFETAAIAIAGNQKGIYYGSVEWGWTMSPSDAHAKLMDFKLKSQDAPSPIFMDAAKLWNASVTSNKEETTDVPVEVPSTSAEATLWDSADKKKKIATLAKNTRLGPIEKKDPKDRIGWQNVIVVSGKDTGKTGWIEASMLKRDSDPTAKKESEAKPKK